MSRIKRIMSLMLAAGLSASVITSCSGEKVIAVKDVPVYHDENFGGTNIGLSLEEFGRLGFEFGDSVNITFSNGVEYQSVPYYNGFYCDPGDLILVGYPDYEYPRLTFNYGEDEYIQDGLNEQSMVTVVLDEKAKYLDIQNAFNISYSDDRSIYPSDTVFANYREVTAGNIGTGILYRSASPCDNTHNRAGYVDRLIEDDGIMFVLDLADSEEMIEDHITDESFDSPYFLSLYENGAVCPEKISINYRTEEFHSKIAEGFVKMSEAEGPYLIHCREGKDRTGFAVALIEMLCGASYDEIVEDYMLTYFNYYGIARFIDDDRYQIIKEENIDGIIEHIVSDSSVDIKNADLSSFAEEYLSSGGMTHEQISTLREKLIE